jgi:hypothetical protein
MLDFLQSPLPFLLLSMLLSLALDSLEASSQKRARSLLFTYLDFFVSVAAFAPSAFPDFLNFKLCFNSSLFTSTSKFEAITRKLTILKAIENVTN